MSKKGGKFKPRDAVTLSVGPGPERLPDGPITPIPAQPDIVHVTVVAPAGRCITGFGSREQGDVFELPADLAHKLVQRDKGLRLTAEKAADEAPAASEDHHAS